MRELSNPLVHSPHVLTARTGPGHSWTWISMQVSCVGSRDPSTWVLILCLQEHTGRSRKLETEPGLELRRWGKGSLRCLNYYIKESPCKFFNSFLGIIKFIIELISLKYTIQLWLKIISEELCDYHRNLFLNIFITSWKKFDIPSHCPHPLS